MLWINRTGQFTSCGNIKEKLLLTLIKHRKEMGKGKCPELGIDKLETRNNIIPDAWGSFQTMKENCVRHGFHSLDSG